MAAHGVGGPSSRVSETSWREFVERVAETLDIGPGARVFDVGCGAGAFLYPLAENGYVVGGTDWSPESIAQATASMPEGQWIIGEASSLDPGEPWDVVVSSGAFCRFPDLDSSRVVLARMMAKATHAVAVLDVPDVEAQDPGLGPGALFFDRGWMLHALADMGASAVQIEDQRMEGDARSQFYFNVFVRLG